MSGLLTGIAVTSLEAVACTSTSNLASAEGGAVTTDATSPLPTV
ncbi:hypothetical protein ACVGVM_29745 (plasmid) [Pseudonocardia bannensis]|nr:MULTISPECIES: hypothetical protein [Pseudonocardia]